jgi:hypothetical protein
MFSQNDHSTSFERHSTGHSIVHSGQIDRANSSAPA